MACSSSLSIKPSPWTVCLTNVVFVLPHYTQAQKRIYLPFFVILFPDCSMHSVCFFCFTEYAFIYIRYITLICSISHCMWCLFKKNAWDASLLPKVPNIGAIVLTWLLLFCLLCLDLCLEFFLYLKLKHHKFYFWQTLSLSYHIQHKYRNASIFHSWLFNILMVQHTQSVSFVSHNMSS